MIYVDGYSVVKLRLLALRQFLNNLRRFRDHLGRDKDWILLVLDLLNLARQGLNRQFRQRLVLIHLKVNDLRNLALGVHADVKRDEN